MAQHPTDMRMGVNCLSGQVRMVGLDPSNGDVYIFVGKSRQVMKILHWEHGGYVVYYKRLEEGRFHRIRPKKADLILDFQVGISFYSCRVRVWRALSRPCRA